MRIHNRAVATSLDEIADPTQSCLVVIDMQNDLCHSDGAMSQRGADISAYQQITPRVAELVAAARAAEVMVIFVRNVTRRDNATQSAAQLYFEQRIVDQFQKAGGDLSGRGGSFEYCVEGTWGSQILDSLGHQRDDPTIDKHRSSAFVGTPLDLFLRSNNIRTVIATGCTTEGCVDSTVRDAGFLDYYTIVVEDCVASDVAELHEAAMKILKAYRSIVVTADQLSAIWAR